MTMTTNGTLPDEVMDDLLTMYLAGEASGATNALVEQHARAHPAFAARLAAAGALSLSDAPAPEPAGDLELRALAQTRQFLFLRSLFFAGGLLFTLLPLVFTFGDGGVQFLVLGRHPGLVWSFWSVAAASWVACVVMQRQVRGTGL
jgi:anti-sigma factor RsiW